MVKKIYEVKTQNCSNSPTDVTKAILQVLGQEFPEDQTISDSFELKINESSKTIKKNVKYLSAVETDICSENIGKNENQQNEKT